MKFIVAFIFLAFSSTLVIAQEGKLLNGMIISEDLKGLPYIRICNTDTTVLSHTDSNGRFSFTIPEQTTELLLCGMYAGVEWTRIKVRDSCARLEVIMMNEWIYDFMSARKINRKRFRRFKRLSQIHQEAFDQKIFQSREPCVVYIFEAH
ncbi:MAG: hypothetical protein AAFU33_28190 [Bacteroidota bacterium]